MAPKVNKNVPHKNNPISLSKEAATEKGEPLISFSFKYLQDDNEKFRYSPHDAGYFVEVLRRLQSVCGLKKIELLVSRSSALRAHPISWSETTEEEFGIPGEEQLVDTPFQFSIGANEHGRIHGFFIRDTFNVVWFDKHHKLYSSK